MDDYELAVKLQKAYSLETTVIDNKTQDDNESLDYAIALSLQEEGTCHSINDDVQILSSSSPPRKSVPLFDSDPKRIVDSSWELVDPIPNIHDLFVQFDSMFFNNVLKNGGVAVNWSSRMTLCAGVCCYEGRGGLCSIKLSEPLLKLRPRKDLVETLLHEMIHALLFVTANNKDREGHGPEFQKQMNRINAATGANITIYHSFHNEVKLYRQHWWKCNGPCQKRPPFYGTVRRAINRAPSSRDRWWSNHVTSCGGTFMKIKEPEGYSEKKSRKPKKDSTLGKGSKNIVDMLNNKTITSTSTSINESNNVLERNKRKKTIVNGVIVLCDDKESIVSPDITLQPSSISPSEEYVDIRSKMLNAVEKRIDLTQRASSVKHYNPTVHKKKTKPTDQVLIDTDQVLIDTDQSSSSSLQTANLQFTSNTVTCPVCGCTDIPNKIITMHIEYCLEEMELDDSDVM